MAISFNKKEVEKRKKQKKLEKQKRKEAKKASGEKASFEDMIAYVDENGVITDTPVDPSEIEEVDASQIEISVPTAEVSDEPENLIGRVDFFNPNKGFGFIKEENGRQSYFFHISNAPENIAEGNRVQYELEKGDRGLNAVNIIIL